MNISKNVESCVTRFKPTNITQYIGGRMMIGCYSFKKIKIIFFFSKIKKNILYNGDTLCIQMSFLLMQQNYGMVSENDDVIQQLNFYDYDDEDVDLSAKKNKKNYLVQHSNYKI